MRKYSLLVVVALILYSSAARAQPAPYQGPPTFSSNCSTSPLTGGAFLCWDTTKQSWWVWNGTNYAAALNTGGGAGTVTQQTFSATGPYTPTAGMKYAFVECVGGGAGGGGAAGATSADSGAGGGGSGGYCRSVVTAAQVGASVTVTIGALGAGGVAGNNVGSNGGNTTFGSLCTANGGTGGGGAPTGGQGLGGTGGTATVGNLQVPGQNGDSGIGASISTLSAIGAAGGNSPFGPGGKAADNSSANCVTGNNAAGFGGGGGGGSCNNVAANAAGGNGTAGYCWVTEYNNI